jgi:hypothetical protein
MSCGCSKQTKEAYEYERAKNNAKRMAKADNRTYVVAKIAIGYTFFPLESEAAKTANIREYIFPL